MNKKIRYAIAWTILAIVITMIVYAESNKYWVRPNPQDIPNPHVFGIATQPIPLNPANTWHNITFNATVSNIEHNIAFENNKTVIILQDCTYLILFSVSLEDNAVSPNAKVATRIALNGKEINGSYIEQGISVQNQDVILDHARLEMQVISDDNSVTVQNAATFSTSGIKAVAYGHIECID